jgi:hypothetical protein
LEKALGEKEEQWNELKKGDEQKLAELELLRYFQQYIFFLTAVLRTENTKLNTEVEQLVREVSLLESRVGKGEYNPATTKV